MLYHPPARNSTNVASTATSTLLQSGDEAIVIINMLEICRIRFEIPRTAIDDCDSNARSR